MVIKGVVCMGLIRILDSDYKLQAILRDVLDCTRYEELNGENTVSFSCVLDEKAQYINDNAIVELDDDYFDVVYYQKKQNEDGTMTVEVEAEHISYRLNNPEYNKDYFTSTGTPINVLTEILEDTGFTIGAVEFIESVTYSAQEAKSRRQILMEFIALLGGEAVFNQFEISILQHRGQIEPQIYTTGKNVKVISKIFDKRQKDKNGNPLVSYVCEPLNLPNRSAGLGDEILLIHNEIGVKETLRIVSVAYNPYDPLICELQIANFVPGLEDQLYRIETNTIAKSKVYNGCKISADAGFEAVRSDNKAKTVLNATEGISIYSDLGSGLVKNFFVDIDGRIKAKSIDIDGSGTFLGTIRANQIDVSQGKITTAQIENLEVGTNVLMGENAYISWDKVTGTPSIPTKASDIGAKPYDWQPSYGDITGIKPPANADNTIDTIGSNRLTYIDQNGIYTGTLTAQQINAIQGIVLGTNATIQWASLPSLPTASQIGALPDNTFIPDAYYITTITKNTVTTTYVNALNVHAGSVDAENITGTYITGKTIRTASSGKRLEMNSAGIISYNSSGQKAGVCIENAPSSGYSKVEFYHNGDFVGSIGLNGLGQYGVVGSIDFSNATVTGLNYSGIASQTWVSDNFASKSHSHSEYASSSHTHSEYVTKSFLYDYLSTNYATKQWVDNNYVHK